MGKVEEYKRERKDVISLIDNIDILDFSENSKINNEIIKDYLTGLSYKLFFHFFVYDCKEIEKVIDNFSELKTIKNGEIEQSDELDLDDIINSNLKKHDGRIRLLGVYDKINHVIIIDVNKIKAFVETYSEKDEKLTLEKMFWYVLFHELGHCAFSDVDLGLSSNEGLANWFASYLFDGEIDASIKYFCNHLCPSYYSNPKLFSDTLKEKYSDGKR